MKNIILLLAVIITSSAVFGQPVELTPINPEVNDLASFLGLKMFSFTLQYEKPVKSMKYYMAVYKEGEKSIVGDRTTDNMNRLDPKKHEFSIILQPDSDATWKFYIRHNGGSSKGEMKNPFDDGEIWWPVDAQIAGNNRVIIGYALRPGDKSLDPADTSPETGYRVLALKIEPEFQE